jgi:hypothetical protein
MSEVGQTRRFDDAPITSVLPLLADLLGSIRHVSNVPLPEVAVSFDHLVGGCQKSVRYLYVECALAVVRLMPRLAAVAPRRLANGAEGN